MKAKLLTAVWLTAVTSDAKSLWSKTPATYGPSDSDTYILKTGYPVGNGKLGVIPFGEPAAEKLSLNVDSLWSGGPFESSEYTGGNPATPKYSALPRIRAGIFQNGTGDVSPLLGSGAHYGSNRVLGNITITMPDLQLQGTKYSNYKRSLDLSTGIHTTEFTAGNANFSTAVFCSYPDQVCIYHIQTTSSSGTTTLPKLTIGFENLLVDRALVNTTCSSSSSIELTGYTQVGGMKYTGIARVVGGSSSAVAGAVKTSCSNTASGNGAPVLVVESVRGQTSQTILIAASTNYDPKKGDKAHNYSFKSDNDPTPPLRTRTAALASGETTYDTFLATHVRDYRALMTNTFHLSLPDTSSSSEIETAVLLSQYNWTGAGDPYLESLLFDYARHLLVSSSRDNSLPANLQGRWTERLDSAWGADYHANINLQMNYWPAEQTGLGEATAAALWTYMRDTWVPRGKETARLLYGLDEDEEGGWVVHNEMNIFGHTAMKEAAQWANYPAAAAWMMQHVWDRFDYSRDVEWLREQGYPLLKGVAAFWVSQLQTDAFSADGSLVVNPCNSPETGPTTFGCAHYQQLIHQVFDNVLSAADVLATADEGKEKENDDSKFIDSVKTSLDKLDKGLHIASWGGLKEWKLPESFGYDGKSTHRHLSHLVGWYPGYSVASYLGGYFSLPYSSSSSNNNTTANIQTAVRQTLISRGMGNGADANAGWEKVWRAACWARLNDSTKAYEELRFAIDTNFAGNGLSMYNALNQPFQIDANFGLAGAVLSMLVVDLPLPYDPAAAVKGKGKGKGRRDGNDAKTRTVVLGPAIPAAWGNGSVTGLRVRGGVQVDFNWNGNGLVTKATPKATSTREREKIVFVNVRGNKLAEI